MADAETDTPQTRTVRAGLGYWLLIYFFTIGFGIMLWIVFQDPFNSVMTAAASTTNLPQAQTGQLWTQQAWDWMPLWLLLLGFILIVARSLVESRRVP